MKLLVQLIGARPATLSIEIRLCFEAARREAAVRGTSLCLKAIAHSCYSFNATPRAFNS
jgi:hypothetical protein